MLAWAVLGELGLGEVTAPEEGAGQWLRTLLKPACRRGRTEASSWSPDLQKSRKGGYSTDTDQGSSHRNMEREQ